MSAPEKEAKKEAENELKVKLMPTYIRGFDLLLEPIEPESKFSGIPVGSTVLICGPIGSGKTTFIMDYLIRGIQAKSSDNAPPYIIDGFVPGIFVSLEESPENILKDYFQFSSWDLESAIANKQLIIIDAVTHVVTSGSGVSSHDIKDFESLSKIIDEYDGYIRISDINELPNVIIKVADVLKEKYKTSTVRVGIDSVTTYISHQLSLASSGGSPKNIHEVRSSLLKLRLGLESRNLTTFLSGEATSIRKTRYGIEEFIARGVIYLGYEWVENNRIRFLVIVKMRGVNHRHERFSFSIDSKNGIIVYDEVI